MNYKTINRMEMDKEQVINSIPDLSAEQLSDFISNGVVNIDELKKTGTLDNIKRRKIKELLNQKANEEKEAWDKAEFGTEEELLKFIQNYPNNGYAGRAKELVRQKREEKNRQMQERNTILETISSNSNAYRQRQIRDYLDKGTITENDLLECGIPKEVVDLLDNTSVNFELGETPDAIPEGYTEVYFWGVPGSGKTCALSAILSKAEREGNLEIATGPGYDYMFQLKNIFSNEYSILPNPTPFEKTQYLPFAIRKNSKKSRSISLIELSGEIFECFYRKNAGKEQKTEMHEQTFDMLTQYLNSDNRKIHFFFIDYQIDNRTNNDGLRQSDYLNAAATYFKDNKIFSKHTDAIYVVLTKSDLMNKPKEEWVDGAKKHIKENHFLSFTNTLKNICKKNSINAGKLYVEPFSIGEVYFRKFCAYDDSTATKILQILKDRIPAKGKSILDVFNK